ncbi:ParB/RepB/Spo0J family partition protein [Paracoccus onubensis]|uniref:ParB/RepB/Spo0J family partition protein n=1 Tax=Paracoccus onubensis TaxID=1675788 RepID=UPI002731BD22|nr:ParB/RepB/Spo0J family partition protein [Paracoccus onubensis]MDP0926201.1 ParB/RepB/Spo0J family partition protein [Paracoccus onubensis]
MAKRRRLETPSSADLDRIEAEFRRETSQGGPGRGLAPIAQVAADSATQAHAEDVDARASRAKSEADAARLHAAEESGLLMVEIPLEEINEVAMIRDRMVMSEEQMQEMRYSIAAHGLRMPIEVFELDRPGDTGHRYGLLSGYRRLLAVKGLYELTEAEKYARIRAIIRPRADADAAFVSMVEENEVRAELSHFERGRIAVIAGQQGAFANTEDAVNKLFASGSKAKRSKVRSFALIFEELGDMLEFPEGLTEKRGLRLSTALRHGAEASLRKVLSDHLPSNADEEWTVIEPVILSFEKGETDKSRGGRPRSNPMKHGWIDSKTIRTSSGITIRRATDSKGHILRFEGRGIDNDIMDSLMLEIQALLEK